MRDVLSQIDHLAYVSPDVDMGVDRLEVLLGVRAAPGGPHPGRGTRNALIALGDRTYLEIIGVDRDQPDPGRPRSFGIDDADGPRLATWAACASDLERTASGARARGVDLGAVMSGQRRRADGVLLAWSMTDAAAPRFDGMLPFLIDWGDTPHPARIATPGCSLVGLRSEHPDAGRLQHGLAALGIRMDVAVAPKPALIATIDSPRGRVELR